MQVNTRETAEGVSHFLRSAGLRNSGFVYICGGGGQWGRECLLTFAKRWHYW